MKTYEEKACSALKRIEEETEARRKKKRAVTKVLTPVMGLCLVAILGVGIWQSGILGRFDAVLPGDLPSLSEGSDGNTSGDVSPTSPEYAVYTDPVNLPENTSGVAADMIGCLVYKGKVYTQSADFYTYDAAIAQQLVGEYVGEAKDILHCLDYGLSKENWEVEFASTYSGPVYKVNGYSEDFRLCIYVNTDQEQWLQILDNYDGIGLNTGSDLFEERLHITGHVERITYQTHDDWEKQNSEKPFTGVPEEDMNGFFRELCSSPFVRIDPESEPGFYERAETQGHLYLHMKDGTVVELRLIDGGYVGCESLGWIFVKMPGQRFDAVLAACQ